MPTLEDDLLQQAGPDTQGLPSGASGDGVRQSLGQLAGGPVEQFLTELLALASDLGILDAALGGSEGQPLPQNILEQVSPEQVAFLEDLFAQIPPEMQAQIKDTILSKLSPEIQSMWQQFEAEHKPPEVQVAPQALVGGNNGLVV
tara:strand:+ start:178 stop:612 length:435 start_codon:yes stop_codon:yes gene_type:complete